MENSQIKKIARHLKDICVVINPGRESSPLVDFLQVFDEETRFKIRSEYEAIMRNEATLSHLISNNAASQFNRWLGEFRHATAAMLKSEWPAWSHALYTSMMNDFENYRVHGNQGTRDYCYQEEDEAELDEMDDNDDEEVIVESAENSEDSEDSEFSYDSIKLDHLLITTSPNQGANSRESKRKCSLDEDLRFTKPTEFKLQGTSYLGVKNWKQLYVLTLKHLAKLDNSRFLTLPDESRFISNKGVPQFFRSVSRPGNAELISDEIWTNCDFKVKKFTNNILALLDYFEILASSMVIYIRTTSKLKRLW